MTNPGMNKQTCSMRSTVRARTVGASRARCATRSKTKTRPGNPVDAAVSSKVGQKQKKLIRGTKTHEEEKRSDARLEARDGVARFPIQPTTEHAEERGYHDVREEERLVPERGSNDQQNTIKTSANECDPHEPS